MGRWYYNKKATVEEALDLTVFQLKKYGMLKSGNNTFKVITWVSSRSGKESSVGVDVNLIDEPHINITYSLINKDGQNQDLNQKINLTTTNCTYGGIRYWFLCPNCWNRVSAVYLVSRECNFKCRNCCNLTYQSRNSDRMTDFGHTSRQIEKLRSQIKRWTWRGKPTRKVKKLNRLEQKCSVLAAYAQQSLMKLKKRIDS